MVPTIGGLGLLQLQWFEQVTTVKNLTLNSRRAVQQGRPSKAQSYLVG